MDPNETLRSARKALATYLGTDDAEEANNASESLADAFEALDEWLTKGGLLPSAWTRKNDGE